MDKFYNSYIEFDSYDNYSTEKSISIKVKLSSDFIYNQKNFKVTNGITEFEKRLKLTSSISLTFL